MGTPLDDGITVRYRPLTEEDRNKLRSFKLQALGLAIIGCSMVLFWVVVIMFLGNDTKGMLLFIIFIFCVILFGIIATSILLAIRKDEHFGMVEVYQGYVTDKYLIPGRPSKRIVKLNGVGFGIDRHFYTEVELGDEVILEYLPQLQELVTTRKTGKIEPTHRKPPNNPHIPSVDGRIFEGLLFY